MGIPVIFGEDELALKNLIQTSFCNNACTGHTHDCTWSATPLQINRWNLV